MRRILLILLLLFAIKTPLVMAQSSEAFSYLTPLSTYELGETNNKEFDEYKFFDGKKWQTVEGRYWGQLYNAKTEKIASDLQIFRNYANAIKAAGGTVLFQGEPPDGGAYYSCYPILTGKISKGNKTIWVLINPCNGGNDYTLHAIEVEAMRQDVTAKDLLDSLKSQGYVALDVRFDTGKTSIKAESLPLLDEVVAMLKASSELKLSVEGHTDNVGADAANQTLSEGRAKAVMEQLRSKGIAAGRLSSAGFGASKPVADNRSEEGRAKNRRVELVKK